MLMPDMNEMFTEIKKYLKNKKYEELEKYISKMERKYKNITIESRYIDGLIDDLK